VVAPPQVLTKLIQAKQGADLHTSTFNQIVAYEVAHGGFLDNHIKLIREVYGKRRDVMLAAMDGYFPPGVDWTHPQGGLFLWATLPENMNSADVLRDAIEKKVAFVPGTPFYPYAAGGHSSMRLNFSNASEEKIREGISRMSLVIKNKLGEPVNM